MTRILAARILFAINTIFVVSVTALRGPTYFNLSALLLCAAATTKPRGAFCFKAEERADADEVVATAREQRVPFARDLAATPEDVFVDPQRPYTRSLMWDTPNVQISKRLYLRTPAVGVL